MCGIVGYVGRDRRAVEVLIDGLRRLEYRGYDSAGVAVFESGSLTTRRAVGKLAALEDLLKDDPLPGTVGIGHTRWATHGKPSVRNAHPHRAGQIAVVHNGIIENYRAIRQELEAEGREIESETDTELVAHLIDREVRRGAPDLATAVRRAAKRMVGSYAIAVMSESEPDRIVAAKQGGSPIILGVAEGEAFLGSDIPALLPYTRHMVFLQDGDFAVLKRNELSVCDVEGAPQRRDPKVINWDPVSAEKGGYDRFMQKEIYEQPRAITDTIGTRVVWHQGSAELDLDGIDFSPAKAKAIDRVHLVACGTAYYASLVGRTMIEQLARVPVEADVASEYRYRRPIVGDKALVIAVSQSGETADTLAALEEAKSQGARSLSICNVREATIARACDDVLYTHAGPEIGVASTKAFTTQVVALYLVALKLGHARGTISNEELRSRLADLQRLRRNVEQVLALDDQIKKIAAKYKDAQDFLYLGRGVMYPIALEGALKLKEISYIHAEAYAAGEMKHGPIALIDENMPVVVIAEKGPVYDKVISNLEVVRARDGQVIAVATEGDREIVEKANEVIFIPDLGDYLSALLAVVPLQLLAYHVAMLKGTDVDQPRNLAKSVTVE
jgi:glucosamine--fructose-6-phosphate aminotransferase (isomerizing)